MLLCADRPNRALDADHGPEWEVHHSQEHLIYMARGTAFARLGPRQLLLLPGYALWLPAQTRYRLEVGGEVDVLIFGARSEGSFFRSPRVLRLPRVGREMMRQTRAWKPVDRKSNAAMAFEESIRLMLPRWYRVGVRLWLPATDHPRLREITDHILDRFDEPLTLSSLARDFGLSRRSINRLFAREMGLSFLTYLRTVRVIRALDLFRRGISVTETAYEVGYNSLCAFSNTFRELVGMRPREYLRVSLGI